MLVNRLMKLVGLGHGGRGEGRLSWMGLHTGGSWSPQLKFLLGHEQSKV